MYLFALLMFDKKEYLRYNKKKIVWKDGGKDGGLSGIVPVFMPWLGAVGKGTGLFQWDCR
jgi:hypothetical protein